MLVQLKRTDKGYVLAYTITNEDASPVDLTGALVHFIMGKKNKMIVNALATVVDAELGEVEYTFTEQDTLLSGNYLGEFRVEFPDGDVINYPRTGHLSINVQQNLDTNLPNMILDAIAERQGEFTEMLESILVQAGNINMSAMNEHTWIATEGQLTYVMPENAHYDPSSKWLEVDLENVKVPSNLINRNVDNQITLIIDPSLVKAGMNVYARWTEPVVPVTDGHHPVHELGGQDEIDITKLKNFQEQVTSPLAENTNDIEGRGINVQRFLTGFNTLSDPWAQDWTNDINSAIDYCMGLPRKTKLVFPSGSYIYSGQKIINATKICFEAFGYVMLNVTGSVNANLPYVFNFQNTITHTNRSQPVFKGFNISTSLTEEVLKTKNTVIFLFETPNSLNVEGAGTHNSSGMFFKDITVRWVPYVFLFGSSAYLLKFDNVAATLCRSVIKVLHPNDPGVLNTTPNGSGRYNFDYGENITFSGGAIGGSWETCIYNKLAAGALNFNGVSIDYWYGGTFLTVGHNGTTNFDECHIEAAHNPSTNNNSYNKSDPSIKWWIYTDGSHMVSFAKCFFYAGQFENRDTTDIETLVKSNNGNSHVNFDSCHFGNMKFTKQALTQGAVHCHLQGCAYVDSIPFFVNLSQKNDNLLFNRQYANMTDITALDNVYCPYSSNGDLAGITNQWTNTTLKVEWDDTEKAFKITRLAIGVNALVQFSYSVPTSDGVMPIKLDMKANGTVTGTVVVKLRGGIPRRVIRINGTTLYNYFDTSATTLEYITDIVPITSVPTTWTTYTQTTANSFINKIPRLKSYAIEVDVNGLAVGESIFVKEIYAQSF